jgi:hypothetical protein
MISDLRRRLRRIDRAWRGSRGFKNRQRQRQIPFGNDDKKSNSNGNDEIQGSFAALRMTTFLWWRNEKRRQRQFVLL